MSWIAIIFLSFIEGLTEFLPISSTGHLILSSALFGINEDAFTKQFNIIIQFGAILAVVWMYRGRFRWNFDFYKKLFLAFLPAAIIGLAIKSRIDAVLGDVQVVAWALILGGILLFALDRPWFQNRFEKKLVLSELSVQDCLKIGLLQCLAFIPGVSRAAASIMGGMLIGLNRKEATEFSFFLAVPTLTAAAALKSFKIRHEIISGGFGLPILIGTLLSFFFALIAIQFFIKWVSHSGFRAFGIYRIIIGLLVLIAIHFGFGKNSETQHGSNENSQIQKSLVQKNHGQALLAMEERS